MHLCIHVSRQLWAVCFTYLFVSGFMHLSACAFLHSCISVSCIYVFLIYVCLCPWLFVLVYLCKYVPMHSCTHVFVYVCVYAVFGFRVALCMCCCTRVFVHWDRCTFYCCCAAEISHACVYTCVHLDTCGDEFRYSRKLLFLYFCTGVFLSLCICVLMYLSSSAFVSICFCFASGAYQGDVGQARPTFNMGTK